MTTSSVLIVGAGPTGLMLALELCRHGVRPRLVDALPGPSPLSRALVVHARTLELLDRHQLADQFVAQGEVVRRAALRVKGRTAALVPLGSIGQRISPFPFLLLISQDQTERLLREALSTYGVQVEWNTSVAGLTGPDDEKPTVTLQNPGRPPELVPATYVVGCDGAHSVVRHALGIGFPGGTYAQVFFVADTVAEGLSRAGQPRALTISLAASTFYGYFPMPGGHTRIIGLLPEQVAPEKATFEDIRPLLEAGEAVRVTEVSWFATYRVHHRVADQFRRGPVFLAGDAAHIHSPAGGQGMNTGLGDAVNLGWKLAAVLHQQAPAALLDTYAAERMPFARQLVATTDRAFTAATQTSRRANFIRTRLVPWLLPLALRLPFVRRLMFRTVSQTGISYPDSPLSQGQAGGAKSGMRLPWVPGPRYAALRPVGWQLLSVGPPAATLTGWAGQYGVPLREVAAAAQEVVGSVYLLRPDGYLGLVLPAFDDAQLTAYARRWGVVRCES